MSTSRTEIEHREWSRKIDNLNGLGTNLTIQTPFTITNAASTLGAGLAVVASDGFSMLRSTWPDGLTTQLMRDNFRIVRNTSGAEMRAGTNVMVTGVTGQVPDVSLAVRASLDTTPAFGLLLDTVANNGFGRVLLSGNIAGLNTTAFDEGAALFASDTAGALTTNKPTSGNIQRIGIVTRSHATQGSIEVDTQSVLPSHDTNQFVITAGTVSIKDGAMVTNQVLLGATVANSMEVTNSITNLALTGARFVLSSAA